MHMCRIASRMGSREVRAGASLPQPFGTNRVAPAPGPVSESLLDAMLRDKTGAERSPSGTAVVPAGGSALAAANMAVKVNDRLVPYVETAARLLNDDNEDGDFPLFKLDVVEDGVEYSLQERSPIMQVLDIIRCAALRSQVPKLGSRKHTCMHARA